MILASQSCRERADGRLAAPARNSFIPAFSLSLSCGAHELIYPTFMLAQQNTAQTCPDSAQQRQLCTSHVLSFTRLMPFRARRVCYVRVTHQMGGRVGGGCPLIMQLARLGHSSAARLFSIFSSLLERENASAYTRWAALTIFGPLYIWITVWDVIKGFVALASDAAIIIQSLWTLSVRPKNSKHSHQDAARRRWSRTAG